MMGLRPQRSDSVDHIIGAKLCDRKRIITGNPIDWDPFLRRTSALHDHEHCNSEIDKFYALVKISCDDRDCGEIYVCSEGTI